MKEVFYTPIFNQAAPSVWDDFARIRAAAMTVNYNAAPSDDEVARWLAEYRIQHRQNAYNVAFAAYCDMEMVGFIRGTASTRDAQIRCLYVLPEYQGQNIGKKLLQYAERSISPITNYIELTALLHAEKFYKRNGYVSVYGTNVYAKRLMPPRCYATALLGCTAHIAKTVRAMAPDVDIVSQISPAAPLYAYYDANGSLDGVLLGNDDNSDIKLLRTKLNSPKDWAHCCLIHIFKAYQDNILRLNKANNR